ncbi:hypothetical protein SeMB42_g06011 [Synchytrium endobioticum]|uniref:non-specific serine/threonine protein kinase n=1 Tax=Synchytrium endobioticum TaxID=286115 RepID=A0A507CGX6_9FUNG|nr:hypothetical protein SeMB42_g06011 [Synchytrium endobioticum]
MMDQKIDPTTLYQVDAQIGRGAYGEVFRGIDKATGTPIAIKILDFEAETSDDIEDIRKEIQILATLDTPYELLNTANANGPVSTSDGSRMQSSKAAPLTLPTPFYRRSPLAEALWNRWRKTVQENNDTSAPS